MIKVFKVFLFFLATLIMGAVIQFVRDAQVIDTMSISYIAVLNVFLGIDAGATVFDTLNKPPADWADIKLYRFVVAFLFEGILFMLALNLKNAWGVNPASAISSFGSGAILTIGIVLAGLGVNKIASRITIKAPA